MRKVEFQRYQIRRRRELKGVLNRYIERAHQYLKDYDDNMEFCESESKLSTVTGLIRTFDELKQYLRYNGESIITEESNFSHEVLTAFLNLCVEKYMDDTTYIKMFNDVEPKETEYRQVDEEGKIIAEYTFGFRTVKEALENDDSIDLDGKDSLKRLLFRQDILEDQAFLNKLAELAGVKEQDALSQLVEELFDIVKKEVYPFYIYLDSGDIRDILVKLAMDKIVQRGYFEGKVSHVFPKKNIYRNFVIINRGNHE